jgi:hypothetical protein
MTIDGKTGLFGHGPTIGWYGGNSSAHVDSAIASDSWVDSEIYVILIN